MARSRNIKPGFFKNDELAEISAFGRLLFAGLWTIADRSGRLEDRAKRIKAEVLPYDNVDVEDLLEALAVRGFILRYEVEGSSYIQIVNWDKHQNPHRNEATSEIPECSDIDISVEPSYSDKGAIQDILESEEHHTSTVQESEEHSTSTVQKLEERNTTPADSFNLIPDSFLKDISSLPSPKAKPKSKDIDYEAIIDQYHKFCPSLPKVQVVTEKRKKAISAILDKFGEQKLEEVLKAAEASDFLSGRAPTDRPWACNIDWILESKNFVKVLEGNYKNISSSKIRPPVSIARGNKFHNFEQSKASLSEEDLDEVLRRKEARQKAARALKTAEA